MDKRFFSQEEEEKDEGRLWSRGADLMPTGNLQDTSGHANCKSSYFFITTKTLKSYLIS